jgi:hypothetical protein
MGLDDIIGMGVKILDKVIPDPAARDAAKIRLIELQQAGDLAALTAQTDLARGQLAVNQVEAASSHVFVSGWRPAIGWVCMLGLLYSFVLQPLFSPICFKLFGTVLEVIDMGQLMTLLLGMLGLGGLRTFEKVKGVAR